MVAATSLRQRPALLAAIGLFNRLVLPLAGTRLLPIYGVLEHRGRRSGRLYRTPLMVRPTPDGFVIPLTWGPTSDWYRNVHAAGTCLLHWRGRRYPLVHPEPIPTHTALRFFTPLQQAGLTHSAVPQCVRLRHPGIPSRGAIHTPSPEDRGRGQGVGLKPAADAAFVWCSSRRGCATLRVS